MPGTGNRIRNKTRNGFPYNPGKTDKQTTKDNTLCSVFTNSMTNICACAERHGNQAWSVGETAEGVYD